MASDTVTRAVAGVSLVVALSVAGLPLLKGPSPHELSILVFPDGNSCGTFTTPQHEAVGRGDAIAWTVHDACRNPHADLRIVGAPVDLAQDDKLKKKGKVQDKPYSTYKYSVYLGSALTEDPELEINR
jgi:hypothetical protein